jgi:hypothetical protein
VNCGASTVPYTLGSIVASSSSVWRVPFGQSLLGRDAEMSDVTEIKEKEPDLMNNGVALRAQGDEKKGTKGRPAGSRLKSSTGGLRRLQVTLTDRGFERLEKMRQMSDVVSQADVVRDALSFYESALEEIMNGKRIVAEDPKNLSDRLLLKR